jgi:hypothetical protein
MQILFAFIIISLIGSYFFFRYFEKRRRERRHYDRERKGESLSNLVNILADKNE